MLHSLEQFSVGATIVLNLAFDARPFDTTAQVRWCRPWSSYAAGYFTGVQFRNLSAEHRTKIVEHLHAEAQRQDSTARAALRMRQRHLRVATAPGLFETQGFEARELSEAGMMLLCAEEYPVDSTLIIELELGGTFVRIDTTVAWRRRTPHEPGYLLGASFVDLQETHQQQLRAYIAQNSKFVSRTPREEVSGL